MPDRKSREFGNGSTEYRKERRSKRSSSSVSFEKKEPARWQSFSELDQYMGRTEDKAGSDEGMQVMDRQNDRMKQNTSVQPAANLEWEDLVAGRNPVREALRAGTPINKILVASGETDETLKRILYEAREKHIQVQEADRRKLNQLAPAHQGVIAFLAAREYSTVDDILSYAKEKGEDPFIVVLDGITDPHNLGAIIRSAECVGAHGVILAQNRAVGLTSVVEKSAAGALQWIRVAKVANITRTLDSLKKQGIWCYAASMDGSDAWSTDFRGPVALVIGDEGKGISRLVE